MLNAMREGAKSGFMKFILLGFMFLAVAGLVLMDIGGFFRGGGGQTYVAKVSRDRIPLGQFDNNVRRVVRQQGFDMETAYKVGLIDWVLRSEVNNLMMRRFAHELGLVVGKQTVAHKIATLIEPFVETGMTPQQALNNALRAQNMSEAALVNSIQAELSTTLIRNAFEMGTGFSSVPEAIAMNRYNNEKRYVKGLLFSTESETDIGSPDKENLEALYRKNRSAYAVPEARTFSIVILDSTQIESDLTIPEEDILAIYQTNIDIYTLPERRQMEQAILPTEEFALDVKNTLSEKIDLEKAVERVTGKKDAYAGSETYELDGLPEEFSGAVFEGAKGDVIGPIQSAFGWHVIHLQEILEPDVTPLEDVRADIEKELMQEALDEELLDLANNIDDSLASGMALDEALDSLGLKLDIKSHGPVHVDGSVPEGQEEVADLATGSDQDYLMETAFDLLEGEIAPVTELSDGSYAIIRMDKIDEEHFKAFEDVKATLTEKWVKNAKANQAFKKAQDAWEILSTKSDASLKNVASESKVKIKTFDLSRQDKAPEELGTKARKAIYSAKQGAYILTQVPDGFFVAYVDTVTLPDAKTDNAEYEESDKIAKEYQQEFFNLFSAALHEKYKVNINRTLLDRYYGQDSEDF